MDMMGTPTRRMTARSRISSWGGGRGEGGTQGSQAQRGSSVPRATQHRTRSLPKLPPPVPVPAFLPCTLDLGDLRGTPQVTESGKKSPTCDIYPGHRNQSWPRMYTMQL